MNAFSACTSVQLLKKLVKTIEETRENKYQKFCRYFSGYQTTYMNNTTHVYLENSKM